MSENPKALIFIADDQLAQLKIAFKKLFKEIFQQHVVEVPVQIMKWEELETNMLAFCVNGIGIICIANGKLGMEAYKTCTVSNYKPRPRIVVTDHNMPGGDGEPFIRNIRLWEEQHGLDSSDILLHTADEHKEHNGLMASLNYELAVKGKGKILDEFMKRTVHQIHSEIHGEPNRSYKF